MKLSQTRLGAALVFGACAVLISSSIVAQDNIRVGPQKPPEIVTGGEQRNVKAPPAGHQVAVVKLVLIMEGGKTAGVRVASTERINSFAPKVFARKSGDWRVTVHGVNTASYLINDPATDIEVENPPKSRSPYSQVKLSGAYDWTLIVPLYDRRGEAIRASEISITDMRADREILRVPLK